MTSLLICAVILIAALVPFAVEAWFKAERAARLLRAQVGDGPGAAKGGAR
jgi:hypothetical protein